MRVEKALIALVLIAFGMWLMPLPGCMLLSVMSFSLLSFLYFPGGFYFLRNGKTGTREMVVAILAGMAFSTMVTGILFRLMLWPGAIMMLLAGFAVMVPAVIALVLLKPNEEGDVQSFYKAMTVRAIVLIVAGLVFFVGGNTLLKIRFRDDPEMARLKHQAFTHPESKQYRQELDAYQDYKDSLQLIEYRRK